MCIVIVVVLMVALMCMLMKIMVMIEQFMIRNTNHPSFIIIHQCAMFGLTVVIKLDVLSLTEQH